MFDTLNRQQQPYIQGGYGAMSRLNTLLGLGGGGAPGGAPSPGGANPGYRPTPAGGVQPIAQMSPDAANDAMPGGMQNGTRLRQLLTLRAANGDTEAARVLRSI